MRKVLDGLDLTTKEKIYYKGHAKATYLSDGRNVEEAIAEISEPESEVFKAVYGETSFAELRKAYDNGKVIHCDYRTQCYVLSRILEVSAYFDAMSAPNSYRIICDNNGWAETTFQLELSTNKTRTISKSSTDAQYPSAKAVYDALQNAGTPSGDPMHYMYVSAGAEYNDTGADITRTGVYGDTITWKAGYWWLNELGDITNEEMREIYAYRYPIFALNIMPYWWQSNEKVRTSLSLAKANNAAHSESFTYYGSSVETIYHTNTSKGYGMLVSNMNSMCRSNKKLTKVLNYIDCQYITSVNDMNSPFIGCLALKEVRIKSLKLAISFQDSPLLSNTSILYMIENEAATSAMVITLHADAYARAMVDAEIVAALEAHPNVSLASA